jgi:hypothetical protein
LSSRTSVETGTLVAAFAGATSLTVGAVVSYGGEVGLPKEKASFTALKEPAFGPPPAT